VVPNMENSCEYIE